VTNEYRGTCSILFRYFNRIAPCSRTVIYYTIGLLHCHYEATSQLATHTQPQVQEPSAY